MWKTKQELVEQLKKSPVYTTYLGKRFDELMSDWRVAAQLAVDGKSASEMKREFFSSIDEVLNQLAEKYKDHGLAGVNEIEGFLKKLGGENNPAKRKNVLLGLGFKEATAETINTAISTTGINILEPLQWTNFDDARNYFKVNYLQQQQQQQPVAAAKPSVPAVKKSAEKNPVAKAQDNNPALVTQNPAVQQNPMPDAKSDITQTQQSTDYYSDIEKVGASRSTGMQNDGSGGGGLLAGNIGEKATNFLMGENGMPITTLFTMIVRFFTSMFGMLKGDKGIDIPDEHKIEITRVVTVKAAEEVLNKAGEFYDTENNRLEFSPEAFKKFTDAQEGLMQFASEFFNKKVQENGGKEIDPNKLQDIMDELGIELSKRIKSDFTDGLKIGDFKAFPLEKDGKKGYLNAATDEVIYADANAIQEYVRKQEASGQKISLDELSKYNNVLWPSVREVSIGKS